jgi:glycosyltransferase involved in cell wall biosynthesis
MVAAAEAKKLKHTVIADRGGFDWSAIQQIHRLVEAESIDIVHASDPRTNLLSVLAFGLRARPRLVATAHGWIANDLRRRMMRRLDKLILRYFDRVILVSRAMESLLPRYWIPRSRVSVLHNALLVGSYGNDVARVPPEFDAGRGIRVLSVGRLSVEKGHEFLLRALAELSLDSPRYDLTIAGVGPMEGSLRSLARDLGIAERVHFAGYVADMPALYASCDVVVQSSLTEGMPNVLLEASLLRKPVIATDVGGSSELIVHGATGTLMPAGSVVAIVDAMRRFAAERETFEAMAERARDRVLSEFSFEIRTRRLTAIYLELVGR